SQAELRRDHAHRGQHDQGIHLYAADAVFDRVRMVIAVAVRHGETVVEECHVEFSGFENPRDLLVVVRGHGIVARVRMPPGARQIGAVLRLQEADQCHLPCHAVLPVTPDRVRGRSCTRPPARTVSPTSRPRSRCRSCGAPARADIRPRPDRTRRANLRTAATWNTAMKHPSLCRPVGSTPKPRPVSRPHSTSTIAASPLPLYPSVPPSGSSAPPLRYCVGS